MLLIHILWSQIHPEVKLDGKLASKEWKSAQRFDLTNKGSLYLLRNKSTLFIGLKGNESGWAHVYFFYSDTVHVLHASAALGAVKYFKKENEWYPIQPFKYSFRDTIYNKAIAAKQEQYFARNGWVANNNNIGTGMILEFKIDLSRWDNKHLQLAFVFLADSKKPQYFPRTLLDDTLMEELVYGNTPDSLRFDTKSWYLLK